MKRIAYLDCASGISGDMILGALVDAGVELAALDQAIASLGLPGLKLRAETVKKCGFRATQVIVDRPHEHAHRHLHHIVAMIDRSRLSDDQKGTARAIFTRLAEAEAKVHGTTVEKVHFHEVGAADSIADIVGAAVGWDLLGVDRVVASPVAVGGGRIHIAHGECSVPAPATVELLRGVPIAPSRVESELATPTGVAILRTVAQQFGPLPAMVVDRIGCGAGQKDFAEQPNLLRLIVGHTAEAAAGVDEVLVLETNLDDASGELVGYCIAQLWEAGALDVYTAGIQMKKDRPGVKLSVLCRPADAPGLEAIIFRETTTLGVRRIAATRHVLPRQQHTVETSWGPIEGKLAWLEDGSVRFAPEFEACRRVATAQKIALRAVYQAAVEAFVPPTERRPS